MISNLDCDAFCINQILENKNKIHQHNDKTRYNNHLVTLTTSFRLRTSMGCFEKLNNRLGEFIPQRRIPVSWNAVYPREGVIGSHFCYQYHKAMIKGEEVKGLAAGIGLL